MFLYLIFFLQLIFIFIYLELGLSMKLEKSNVVVQCLAVVVMMDVCRRNPKYLFWYLEQMNYE